jgi:hypothetical protein
MATIAPPDNWQVEPHPKFQNDQKKAQWKPKPGGGYGTKPGNSGPPAGFETVNTWIKDMNDWGMMMHEAVIELRQRVDDLERKGGRRYHSTNS